MNLTPRTRLAPRRPTWGRAAPAGAALLLSGLAAVVVAVPADAALAGPKALANASVVAEPAHVDNPYLGAKGYVNPEWKAQADQVTGGSRISNTPTSVWIDRVALAIGSLDSRRGLQSHLEAALAQGAGYVQVVLDNLPGKNCDWGSYSTDEFKFDQVDRYQREFIDPIAAIEGNPKYRSLHIINIVEPRWVQNLVLNTGNRSMATQECNDISKAGSYVTGVQYALTKLHKAAPNIYTYLDAGVYYELGWDSDSAAALKLIVDTVKGTADGFASVDGFATNIAGYAPLVEPFFTIDTKVGGTPVLQSKWVDWNKYIDELPYATKMRLALINAGFSAGIGMIIDTSRNGWGGKSRPVKTSGSTGVDTFVDESRVDRRLEAGNWCNQKGAGLGERPIAAPKTGIDAYAWIKTPGESDGSSDRTAIGADPMCDPAYSGSHSSRYRTGAMPGAPARNGWFPTAFTELMMNAYPPLS